VSVLAEMMGRASEAGLAVVLDAKRGDIGVSAEHYAASAKSMGAGAITVNAYLGPETIKPYLSAGLGAFVLVRTSNPDSDAVQSLKLSDGRTVGEMMADHVAGLGAACVGSHGYSDVGAVVGATKAEDGRALRARMPKQFFLVPGDGAQGGTADDIRGAPGWKAGVRRWCGWSRRAVGDLRV
jgi:orotidine-5'-phosphate decarboxylase